MMAVIGSVVVDDGSVVVIGSVVVDDGCDRQCCGR